MEKLRIYILCIVFVSCGTLYLRAQPERAALWTKFGVNHALNSAWTLKGEAEMRTQDGLQEIDRWGVMVGADYRVASFLKVAADYEFHYRHRLGKGWQTRNRYNLAATGTLKLAPRWKVSLRERFQHTFADGGNEKRMRTRLKLMYSCTEVWEPYLSAEVYHNLDKGETFYYNKTRYRAGTRVKLASDYAMKLFYCWETERDDRNGNHILGIEGIYSF